MARSTAWLVLAAACAATNPRATHRNPASDHAPEPKPQTDDAGARLTTRIDTVMKPWARTDAPGCAVAVIQNQKLLHAKGYGIADLEHAVPITPDTVFYIASISKQFTASAVLLAAAEGKLHLDDDIRIHVPALPKLGETPTTIRHLLHHTGGLRDYMALLFLAGHRFEDVTTVVDAIDALARQRGVDFPPGTKHEYSNTGYFLLAQAVEHATKQSLAAYLDAKIFAPLDMTRSSVDDDSKRIIPGRAIAYAPRGKGWAIEMWPWEQTGDGGVMTTVLDLAKWDANFYDPKVGGRPLVDGLLVRGKLGDGTKLDYAAGLAHGTYRGQPTVWHSGGWAGYQSQFERFPALETSVVVLCNAGNAALPDLLAHRIADVVLEKHLRGEPTAVDLPSPTIELSSAELDAWVATYREVETGDFITVERAGDELEVLAVGERFVLAATTSSTFNIADTPLVLRFEGKAPHRTLVAKQESSEQRFSEVERHEPTAREVAALVGRYRSEEVDTEWTLAMSEGTLVATGRAFEEPAVVAPAAKDEYTIVAIGAAMRIRQDKRGRITGFALSMGATRGLRFDRVR